MISRHYVVRTYDMIPHIRRFYLVLVKMQSFLMQNLCSIPNLREDFPVVYILKFKETKCKHSVRENDFSPKMQIILRMRKKREFLVFSYQFEITCLKPCNLNCLLSISVWFAFNDSPLSSINHCSANSIFHCRCDSCNFRLFLCYRRDLVSLIHNENSCSTR